MSKKVYITIIILSLLLCGSIVFLGFSICYGLTHQATKFGDVELNLGDEWPSESKFIIQNLNN